MATRQHRARGLLGAIRRFFRTETHQIKGRHHARARPRTSPRTWFLRATLAGRVRWRVLEQIAIHRGTDAVKNVTDELTLALMAQCAVVEPWDPEDPPAEVMVLLTGTGEDALIERARRQAKAKQKKATKR